MRHLDALAAVLDAIDGTASVWCGSTAGRAAYRRHAAEPHYAASTMKVAVLAALYREAECGRVDIDREVPVHNSFASAAAGAPRYGCQQRHDEDDAVWHRLGSAAPLRWLAERMIVRSSNLATNIVLEHVGRDAVEAVWHDVGARGSTVGRGIEDTAAADAGITNLVTAADLAALLGAIASNTAASPASCTAMIETLLAQERTEDLVAGLPPGTRVAHKNGWITGIRHSAGVIFPADAQPFVLAVCLTTPLAVNRPGDKACQIVSTIARAAWLDRRMIASSG